MGPKIYLAGPMRGHPVEVAMGWRRDLADELGDQGYQCVLPGMIEEGTMVEGKFEDRPRGPAYEKVVSFDFHMVSKCDYLVVNLGYSFRMPVGSLAEISWAFAMDIPVIVIGDNDYVREPFIQEQAITVVPNVEDVLPTLAALEGTYGN